MSILYRYYSLHDRLRTGLAAVLVFIFFSLNVSPIEKLQMKICTKDE